MDIPEPPSLSPRSATVTGARGPRVHQSQAEHTERLKPRLFEVADGVWCQVGNGLSNQTFVRAPGGLIAIDTGESIEEMQAALDAVRAQISDPVVAVIYTHYHYVDGTAAVLDGRSPDEIQVWGHPAIARNRAIIGGEISPVAQRGLVHQFGILLPSEGPDAVENVGLGLHYRNPAHAPYTAGHLPVTHPVGVDTATEIGGLPVEFHPTPTDADDNVTIWFPTLGVCVNNSVWPALFNVFAIRGEEYRDPQTLLDGLDHILGLSADHLVGAHGPPISGAAAIEAEVTSYRDSIQFMWDQTVRGINKGLTGAELGRFVQLPARFAESYLTQQHYGLVEHHVRQIHAGLRGWFDGDVTDLLPLVPAERGDRLVAAMGGPEVVAGLVEEALDADDLRWSLHLAGLLHQRTESEPDDGTRLGRVLREVAVRTTSANLRNWCLTAARDADGSLDLSRFRVHRFAQRDLLSADAERLRSSVRALRVTLDPLRAENRYAHLAVTVGDLVTVGLRLRGGLAIPTDGDGAELAIAVDQPTWAALLSGRLELSTALESGVVVVERGSADDVEAFFAPFEVGGLSSG